jgi:hypothetical protein
MVWTGAASQNFSARSRASFASGQIHGLTPRVIDQEVDCTGRYAFAFSPPAS